MKKLIIILLPALLLSCRQNKSNSSSTSSDGTSTESTDATGKLSDEDISNAYGYLLAREIVLRQKRLDFEKEGFEWNKIIYRTPGGVAWANPNLDVAYSEAWIAVDGATCVLLEIPKITSRYYTWQMLNGWGETLLNINERTYPQHPYGKFALCLKGSNPKIPDGALRIDLPYKTARVLSRVELGGDPKEALRLQHLFKLTVMGSPVIDTPLQVPLFANDTLPGAEMFETASAVLASEPDINPGMDSLQTDVKAIELLVKSTAGKARVDSVIKTIAMPTLFKYLTKPGPEQNGWIHPAAAGNYGDKYWNRTMTNLAGLWANNSAEATYFGIARIDGSNTYTVTFPKDKLPKSKAKYFWSVIAVDAKEYRVLPNPLKRYLLNKQSPLKYNADSSLIFVFAPTKPTKYPEQNWLPTEKGVLYNLTFRFYGPSEDVVNGTYFPPALIAESGK